jgi:hypothetical protein
MDQAAEPRGARGLSARVDGLSSNVQAHIGRHVREVFDEVAREPIPERLLQLLKDLEQSGDE